MNKFKFESTETQLDIEENVFIIDLGKPESIKAFEQLSESTMKLLKEVECYRDEGKGDIEKMSSAWCESVKKAVNKFLGEGSYEKIFAGRTVNLIHHFNLLSYIISEINQSDKKLY